MNGFGGAGSFSDGKYNITNEFGGNLYEYVGEQEAIDLMEYVDEINCKMGGEKHVYTQIQMQLSLKNVFKMIFTY